MKRQRNLKVAEDFTKGIKSESYTGSLYSTGDRLISYSTCIAEWTKDGKLRINVTKYSTTTSKHLSHLLCYTTKIYNAANVVKYVYDVPINSLYLSNFKNYVNAWQCKF